MMMTESYYHDTIDTSIMMISSDLRRFPFYILSVGLILDSISYVLGQERYHDRRVSDILCFPVDILFYSCRHS